MKELIVAGIVALSASAPSAQPNAKPQAPTETEQKSTETVAPPKPTAHSAEDRIADYTFWLTIMTGVLAGTTALLWWTTKSTLRHMGREYVTTNRPQLRLRQLAYDGSDEVSPKIHYTIANTGQSRARITESNFTVWQPVKNKEWPGRPPYSAARDSLGQVTIEAGQDHIGVYQDPEGEIDLIAAKILGFKHQDTMLLGYVVYLDDNNTPRRLGFCRQRLGDGDRFVPVDDPDYEFFY